jgi:hypothetical protein
MWCSEQLETWGALLAPPGGLGDRRDPLDGETHDRTNQQHSDAIVHVSGD